MQKPGNVFLSMQVRISILTNAKEKMHDIMGKAVPLQEDAVAGILPVKRKREKSVSKALKAQKSF